MRRIEQGNDVAISLVVRDSKCQRIDISDLSVVAEYHIAVWTPDTEADNRLEFGTGALSADNVLVIDNELLAHLAPGQIMVRMHLRLAESSLPDGKFDVIRTVNTDMILEKEVIL